MPRKMLKRSDVRERTVEVDATEDQVRLREYQITHPPKESAIFGVAKQEAEASYLSSHFQEAFQYMHRLERLTDEVIAALAWWESYGILAHESAKRRGKGKSSDPELRRRVLELKASRPRLSIRAIAKHACTTEKVVRRILQPRRATTVSVVCPF